MLPHQPEAGLAGRKKTSQEKENREVKVRVSWMEKVERGEKRKKERNKAKKDLRRRHCEQKKTQMGRNKREEGN